MPNPSTSYSDGDVDMVDIAPLIPNRSRASTMKRTPSLPHSTPYPAVTLYIGPHRQKHTVPASLLTKLSIWFAEAVKNNCTLFHLTAEDPTNMRLLLEFLHDGHYTLPHEDSLPTRDFHGARTSKTYMQLGDMFPACRFDVHKRHVKMYFLGERFEIPTLRTYAFNMVYALLEKEDVAAMWKYEECEIFVEERLRLVMMLYRTPKADARDLRKLFAFKAAETWNLYMECLEINKGYQRKICLADLTSAIPEFVHDVLMLLGNSRTSLALLGKDGFLDAIQLQNRTGV